MLLIEGLQNQLCLIIISDVVNRAAFRVALGSHRAPTHSVGSGASYHSSRRSSEDSSEDGIINIRDMRVSFAIITSAI